VSRDFVNDGQCIICGHLQKEIAAGAVKACIDWPRLEDIAGEDEEDDTDEA
jgi:hypothetical protein